MSDDESEAQYFNLQVRQAPEYVLDSCEVPLYPRLRYLIANSNGAHLQFRNDDLGRRYGRNFRR